MMSLRQRRHLNDFSNFTFATWQFIEGKNL
jgi:hypothetical protein